MHDGHHWAIPNRLPFGIPGIIRNHHLWEPLCKNISAKNTKHVWNVLPVIPIDSLYRFSQDFDAPLLVEDSRLLLRADDGTGGWMAWRHLGRHLWAKILRACPKLG